MCVCYASSLPTFLLHCILMLVNLIDSFPPRHAKKVFALSQGLIVPLHVNIAYNDLKYGKFIKIFHHLSTNSTHSFALRCSLPFNLPGLSHCLKDIMLPCMLQAHISTGCHTPPFVNMEGSYIC